MESNAGKMELAVTGMTCGNCARSVREAIQAVPEVASASVALAEGRATLQWRGESKPEAVLQAIAAAGFEAKIVAGPDRRADGGWRNTLVLGLAVTLPLMAGEWIFHLGNHHRFQWVAFALAIPVQVFCGARFYRGAWRQLKVGSSNMDTLVALGSTTAFAFSVWVLFTHRPGHLYFMEAAAIITLVSLGHYLEARMSVRAESALQALLNLKPQLARRREADGAERELPLAELQPGDVMILKPGDQVPVDGEVLSGESSVNEAMLTGEAMPVEKKPGAKLFAGTLNSNGRLEARVTATGEATALAHIIAAVSRAQNSRANIQRLGDRISSIFVPVVVLIALGTALWWRFGYESARDAHDLFAPFLWASHLPAGSLAVAVIQATAVLIIACPCAMGLATPIAIMAATNAAARRGILVRDGIALERAGTITAVVFDKTGTLTQGRPSVAAQEIYSTTQPELAPMPDAITLAAALARRSQHPISQAIAAMKGGGEVPLLDWQEQAGSGVQARLENQASLLRLGSLRWLSEAGVKVRPGKKFSDKWAAEGSTLVGLACNQELRALLAIRDELKAGAAEVVHQLQGQKLKIYLVTGDNYRTAQALARQLGLPQTHVFAEARPEQKADYLRQLQKRGECVAFVGDGINDAPALKTSDLAIAVSRASDVAGKRRILSC